MKNTVFTGAGVAIITPMNSDGSINFENFETLIDYQIDNGTDAIIVCGTTGEASTMTDDEHLACIERAVKRVNKRVPVIAGTGSNDTAYAIELSQKAESVGADALLIVTPYYNKTSQRGLVAHFTAIADAVNIPIIIYNIPGRTNINISMDTYKKLAAHRNIVGVKEASGNMAYATELIAQCGDLLDIYSGCDEINVPIMSVGGKGAISVLSNILPKETHEMTALCLANDFAGAAKLQLRYFELINALFCDVNPIPVKEAMNMMGLNVGSCRLPLYEMEQEKLDSLRACLGRYNLL